MPAGGAGQSRRDAPERVIDTQDLFGGAREVLIRHNDAVYRLRITRFGKLILNK
jgi:hemin uptake protein HemP